MFAMRDRGRIIVYLSNLPLIDQIPARSINRGMWILGCGNFPQKEPFCGNFRERYLSILWITFVTHSSCTVSYFMQ